MHIFALSLQDCPSAPNPSLAGKEEPGGDGSVLALQECMLVLQLARLLSGRRHQLVDRFRGEALRTFGLHAMVAGVFLKKLVRYIRGYQLQSAWEYQGELRHKTGVVRQEFDQAGQLPC